MFITEMTTVPNNKKELSSPEEVIEQTKETPTISKMQIGGNI